MKPLRAGDSVEDYCRACKLDRMHTVVAADPEGLPIRVACGYCGSEHNYRGGPRTGVPETPASGSPRDPRPAARQAGRDRAPFPPVADRERIAPPMTVDHPDIELLLRRIIREETGLTTAVPADRWRGGMLVLKPGNDTQEKSWPIETFFHKIVMIRNRLRTLEQQVNATELPADVKVKLQAYISGCYGTLTSFNVLFADEADQLRGTGGD
ncbi:MAG TPA: hypothetical protein VD833_15300 [Vicinamibacterales bacterium]|nr:hypothetical protein [Vicinamibacterales bacterium]